MKKSITRILSTSLLLVVMLTLSIVPAFASYVESKESTIEHNDKTQNDVIAQATKWLEKNYGDFYELRNVHADVARVFENDTETRYTVAMTCETMLKFDSVKDLPFVKGLESALVERNLQACEKIALDTYIGNIDANIGEYRDLAVDVVIEISKEDNTAPWVMYFQDGMETTLYAIDMLALDAKQMYDAGQSAANNILESSSKSANRGYTNYDRIAARDYALAWSSNPTSCYDCGTSCQILQNRTLWNNTVYPYHSLFMHNDCANFVSQAMSAGGLPESGTWFRTKNVSTQSWGAAWTSVSSMKAFMTDSSRKYWDASTFAAANAGNILLTSSSHVTMITLNDTVTHRFTGHTNDRKDYVFSNNSAYQYYTIKTT